MSESFHPKKYLRGTWPRGRSGQWGGRWFDGQTGYVDAGNGTSLDVGAGDFTLFVRLSSRGTDKPQGQEPISKWLWTGTAEQGYLIRQDPTGICHFVIGDGTTNKAPSFGNLTNNVIYSLVATRSSGNLKLYKDGVLVHSTTTTLDSTNTSNFKVGEGGFRAFNGNVYEVILLKEGLTQSEIRGLMEGRRLPTEWDCRLWLDFRQAQQYWHKYPRVFDLSGHGNHGTIYGGVRYVV